MKSFNFLLMALATWRISNIFVNEDGPWLMFEHLRLRAGLQPPELPGAERQTDPPGKMPGTIFNCVWCFSMYVAVAWVGLYAVSKTAAKWVSLPFALSAIACLLDWMNGWSDR